MIRSSFRSGCGIVLVAMLPGCMQGYGSGAAPAAGGPRVQVTPQGMALRAEAGVSVLDTLGQRPGAILPGTPYAAIAKAVLEGSGFRTEAELRVARLRGEAEELAWLPGLGPRLSLAALRRMASSVLDRPDRFDTERKLAERDEVLAMIDDAALTLAEEANAQVFAAIGQHLVAEESRARAGLLEAAYRDLAALDWPIAQGSAGAKQLTLDRLRAQVARVRAALAEARRQEAAARAELADMGDGRLGGVEGIGALRELHTPPRLSQLQAQVDDARRSAKARQAAHVLLDGMQPRRLPEELAALEEAAGFDGEGSGADGWDLPGQGGPLRQAAVTADALELGASAQERERLRVAHSEAKNTASAARAAAVHAQQQFRGGGLPASALVDPLVRALDTGEAEVALRFGLARSEVRLAYLRGTLVPGSAL